MTDQLKVSPPATFTVAERILGGTPVCPLNGKYALGTPKKRLARVAIDSLGQGELSRRASTAGGLQVPVPALVHGLDLEFNIDATSISSRIELVVER